MDRCVEQETQKAGTCDTIRTVFKRIGARAVSPLIGILRSGSERAKTTAAMLLLEYPDAAVPAEVADLLLQDSYNREVVAAPLGPATSNEAQYLRKLLARLSPQRLIFVETKLKTEPDARKRALLLHALNDGFRGRAFGQKLSSELLHLVIQDLGNTALAADWGSSSSHPERRNEQQSVANTVTGLTLPI